MTQTLSMVRGTFQAETGDPTSCAPNEMFAQILSLAYIQLRQFIDFVWWITCRCWCVDFCTPDFFVPYRLTLFRVSKNETHTHTFYSQNYMNFGYRVNGFNTNISHLKMDGWSSTFDSFTSSCENKRHNMTAMNIISRCEMWMKCGIFGRSFVCTWKNHANIRSIQSSNWGLVISTWNHRLIDTRNFRLE